MLPTRTQLSRDATLMLLGNYMVFVMSYFKFLPSLIMVEVCLVPFFVFRYVFYYEEPSSLVQAAIFYMLNILLAFTFMHIIVTKVGMIFVEAEVLREGNEKLLDNLDEGVIITDETSQVVLFQNKTARATHTILPPVGLNKSHMPSTNMKMEDDQGELIDLDYEGFAAIDMGIFQESVTDTINVVQKLSSANEFISIKNIVTENLDKQN